MGVVSCRLSVRAFVLEIWSWSGNIPINLYQMNAILYSDKKGQSPRVQFSPSQVPVLTKRRQISVGSSFLQSAQLSSLREPGTQPTDRQSPQPIQMGRPGPPDCGQAEGNCYQVAETGMRKEVHCCLKAWAKASGGP